MAAAHRTAATHKIAVANLSGVSTWGSQSWVARPIGRRSLPTTVRVPPTALFKVERNPRASYICANLELRCASGALCIARTLLSLFCRGPPTLNPNPMLLLARSWQ